jgi:hypothetical protein
MINPNAVRKVDMPANLFSNLGGKDYKTSMNDESFEKERSIVKTNNELAEDMKEYYESGDIKLNKLNNQKSYRNRLNKMYENLKGLKPIDGDIKDTIFTSNYIEKGIVIKPTIQEMKQFWTEYRLMNNERKTIMESEKIYNDPISLYTNTNNTPSEFDELFDKLTNKVNEINSYIDELKKLKISVDNKDKELKKNKEDLELERQRFLNYKQEEEEKIRKEKENLKVNFNKLQSIIDSLDEKLDEV